MKVDSINKLTEDKIREQIIKIEKHFEDPKVEEETGKLIGDIIMQQQMTLLDLQVERALSFRDTLLLYGLKTALQEMVLKNPEVQEQLLRLIDKVEREYDKAITILPH
jgi:CRP-like cAMP-binding protein